MNIGRLAIGAILVTAGVLLLLDQADAVDAGSVAGRWWPVVLIAAGGVHALLRQRISGIDVLLMSAGAILLALTTGAAGELPSYVWPMLVTALGVWILIRGRVSPSEPTDHTLVLFSSRTMRVNRLAERYSPTVVFGSARLDLTEAEGDVTVISVDASVLFGSLDIIVPPGWAVTIKGIPIFGGWDDTTSKEVVTPTPRRLEVRLLAVFGGLEAMHPERWG